MGMLSTNKKIKREIGRVLKPGAYISQYRLKRELEKRLKMPLRGDWLVCNLMGMKGYWIDCGSNYIHRYD